MEKKGTGAGRWWQVAGIVLGIVIVVGHAQAQSLRTKAKYEVIDNTKKVVGEANIGTHGSVHVIFQDQALTKGTFALAFERNKIVGDHGLYYENDDCTGEHGLLLGEDGQQKLVSHIVAVAPPGNTVYIMDRETPVTRMTARSFWWTHFDFCQILHEPYENEPVTPVVPLVDLNTVFTPPFHIR